MTRIYETTRGRPVAIEAVPQFCPVCGYTTGRDVMKPHALAMHRDRLATMAARPGSHGSVISALVLLVTVPTGLDHGPDPFDVILLDSQGKHVETFDAHRYSLTPLS